MKKNVALSRSYVGSYFVWVFGGLLFPMLLIKFSNVLALIAFIIAVLDLACIIVSHVFYTKKPKVYPIVSFAGQGLLALYVLTAYIIEIIFALQGKGAMYALVIGGLALLGEIAIAIFVTLKNLKFMKELKK